MADDPQRPSPFADILRARYSRRLVLAGLGAGAGAAAMALFAPPGAGEISGESTLRFANADQAVAAGHAVAPGYRVQVLIRWGDPVLAEAPAFAPEAQTAAAQARQFGYNNDFIAFVPPRGAAASPGRGLLCVSHEYVNTNLMRSGVTSYAVGVKSATAEWCAVEQMAVGLSIVDVAKVDGAWRVEAGGRHARRITAATPMRIAGPAAGHPRLRTAADPAGTRVLGTFANCSGGKTPWGTILSGEENVSFFFAGAVAADSPEARNHRVMRMASKETTRYAWFRFDPRFDIDREPTEPNRFGWVVEIDPHEPASTPVKRTALGRFAHEGATCWVNVDGRVVVYSGDDAADQFIYRFVTRGTLTLGDPAANRDLLDDGTLSAARFKADGTVEWLDLVHGQGPLTAANGFAGQADVLIEARTAAKLLGATPMDRPEDIEAHPQTGRLYVALTNGASRGKSAPVDAANPRANNRQGHIVELIPPGEGRRADHAAATMRWGLFLLAGDPHSLTDGARYHPGQAASGAWLACPDNVAFDPQGRLWIATDQGSMQTRNNIADGLFGTDTAGPGRALVKALFSCPRGAEMCGPEFTPDGKTVFLSVQHPGEERNSTYDTPSTRWPDFNPDMPPRPSVVAVTRADGGTIGG